MSSRTTTSVVTFPYPFVVAGYTDELPAGEYQVLADDEVMQIRRPWRDMRIHKRSRKCASGQVGQPIGIQQKFPKIQGAVRSEQLGGCRFTLSSKCADEGNSALHANS